jgi:Universal stress protein family
VSALLISARRVQGNSRATPETIRVQFLARLSLVKVAELKRPRRHSKAFGTPFNYCPGPLRACRYLQLNEVPAKPLTVGLDGRLTGEVVLAHAKALGCDLLIKGAYTQSRLRQMIFGGTTRYILSNAELPVLMAH